MKVVLFILFMISSLAHAELTPFACGTPNVCVQLPVKLAPLERDQFSKIPQAERRGKFIAWLQPYALTLQAWTGFPASVLIAQAGYHSLWGASESFRLGKNIFSFACAEEKSENNFTFESNGVSETVQATCTSLKVEGKARLLYSYPSYEASVISYLSLLLNSRLRLYRNLQSSVKEFYHKTAPGVASYRLVLGYTGDFATRESYRSELSSLIEEFHLQNLDNNPCQSCLFQQRHLKDLMESTQPKANP